MNKLNRARTRKGIAAILDATGLTQAQLAEMIGASLGTVKSWTRKNNPSPISYEFETEVLIATGAVIRADGSVVTHWRVGRDCGLLTCVWAKDGISNHKHMPPFPRSAPSIRDYYANEQERIRVQILGEKDETILFTDSEKLAEYYVAKAKLQPIEFDPQESEHIQHKKELRRVPASQRSGPYGYQGDLNFEYDSIIVTMPIICNHDIGKIMSLNASTYSTGSVPELGFTLGTIFFSVDIKGYGFQSNADQAATAINHSKDLVKQMIGWKNSDIASGNRGLENFVHRLITDRKSKLEDDKSLLASLVQKVSIPLKQKPQEAASRITLDPKSMVQKVKPNPKMPEEYTLDRSKVLDIIQFINNQGRQFEQTPSTYKTFGEEDLRNVILVTLNSLFEGKATGETFSKKGKTDIHLNIDKGNILIAECKLWSGKALYSKTIDQLLGYLTWRNNFGVMITFVNQKSFSKVLDEAPNRIKEHPSFRSGYHKMDSTHFMSMHVLPDDEMKNVEIHHLFYNLYVDVKS